MDKSVAVDQRRDIVLEIADSDDVTKDLDHEVGYRSLRRHGIGDRPDIIGVECSKWRQRRLECASDHTRCEQLKPDRIGEAAGKRLKHPGGIETTLFASATEQAMTSRLTSENFIPWWFFGEMSETEIVVNSRVANWSS